MKKQIFFSLLMLISVKGFGQVPSYIDTASLKAWYPFTGNANDSSGFGNNETVYGATLTTDRFGNSNSAYSFDGISQYIAGSGIDSFHFTNILSISAWVKLVDYTFNITGEQIRTIVGKSMNPGGGGFNMIALEPTANKYDFGLNNGSLNYVVASTDTLALSVWQNIVAVYDSVQMSIYRDGNLISTVAHYITLNPSSQPLCIGKEGALGRFFKGSIDDVALWKRALTSCEIKKIYLSRNSLVVNNPINDTVLLAGVATYTITDTGGTATYQWQENAGSGFVNIASTVPYSGTTTKILTINPVAITMNNYYYRCVRIGAGSCVDTSNSAKLVVQSSTGFINLPNEQITISPNPGKNLISISSPVTIEKIEITNMVGQKLIRQTPLNNSTKIDVQDLAPGIYILKINDNCIKRFVKD